LTYYTECTYNVIPENVGCISINVKENRRQLKMDNPEKLTTYGTQDKTKQGKNTI